MIKNLVKSFLKPRLVSSQGSTASNFPKNGSICTSPNLKDRSNYCPSYYWNMDARHLAKGSTVPPLQPNKVRIYSMRYCPFAQRAILVALAKGILHDVVNCNLKEKAEWLLDRNPEGKVPVLELEDGRIIYESLIVSDYFDDAYDETRSLHSLDPVQRAIDRIWIAHFDKAIVANFYKLMSAFKRQDEEAFEKSFGNFENGMRKLEKELERRTTKFFGGKHVPGMLDYMIWPWMERLEAFPIIFPKEYGQKVEILIQTIPKLNKWKEQMLEDFAVKEFLLPTSVHVEFIQSLLSGSPNYDILDANFAKL